jgi:pimeloyl-ACP methyl ester carboxylesterase
MATSRNEEIVYTETEDGLLLEGVLMRPRDEIAQPLALVWVHGLTSKFYAPTEIKVGRGVVDAGYTVISGNNRGHDFGSRVRRRAGEVLLGGGGWELFDESPRDVAAWIGFAQSLGFERVALLGHSLGALKVTYYQAQRRDPRVAGVVAASPPLRAGRFDSKLVALAQQMVADGHGQDLLPWGSTAAGAGTMSAATYLHRVNIGFDFYGVDVPEPAVSRIECPLLVLFGTENDVGTADDLELIRRNASSAARVDTAMIAGGDHGYTGQEAQVAGILVEWLGRLG